MARLRVDIDAYSAYALAESGLKWRDHDVVLVPHGTRGEVPETAVSAGDVLSIDLDEITKDESTLREIAERVRKLSDPVVSLTGITRQAWRDGTVVRVVRRLRGINAPVVLAPPPDADLRRLARVANLAMVYAPAPGTSGSVTVRHRGLFQKYTVSDALGRLDSMGALAGGLPMAGPLPPESPPARFVNTIVSVTGTTRPVATDRPLATDSSYDLLVSIGQYLAGSLLPPEDAGWPEVLPSGAWLRAVVAVDGATQPMVQSFFLPAEGDSYACDCPVGQEHQQDCARRPWVSFPVHTPAQPAVIHGELVIYHEVAAVHAQRLTLPVGTGQQGPRATILGRFSRSFSDLGKLAGRTASVVLSPSRVVVNGLSFAGNPFAIPASAADTSSLSVRQVLYRSHFSVDDKGEHSRYRDGFTKPAGDFEHDLRYLAKEGAQLYARLLSPPGADNIVGYTMPGLLRQEASLRGRPPVLQVVDPAYDEHAMLWAAVYDLPVGGDPLRYRACPSVREFGPGGARSGDAPFACPYEAEHESQGNVLCPFGFWGLSCVLEQPPSVSRDLESVVDAVAGQVSVLLAAGADLDWPLTEDHVAELQRRLPAGSLLRAPVETETDLAAALAGESMDVVYFYCHSGYEQQGQGAANRYLSLGDYYIEPINVNMWARTSWPDPHWPTRHPLVVLNGCHTTEATSGTVNSFVPAFTQWASAAGVLGTEVTMEQGLAGWVAEEILAALASGSPIGEAVRHARWKLFGRGNVMGFAYTPYCLANLALRPFATT